jgi:hypothetical protein
MMPLTELEQRVERQESIARSLDELGQARGAAYLRSRTQAERMFRERNLDARDYFFQPGDWVKVKNHQSTKFDFEWKGPFMIDQLGMPGTYWIKSPSGERGLSTINQSELAPWLSKTLPNESYFYDGRRAPGPPAAGALRN